MKQLAAIDPRFLLAFCAAAAGLSAFVLIGALLPGEVNDPLLRGHRRAERDTAFARQAALRLAWPLVRMLTFYTQRLPIPRLRETLRQKLAEAGDPLGLSPDEFLALNVVVASAITGVGVLLAHVNHLNNGVIVVFALFGVVMPYLRLSEMVSARFKAINRGLPPVLDLVVMAMTAGADFVGALGYVISKWSRKRDPLYHELLRFFGDLKLGVTRREALEALALRAPTELVKTFSGSVIEAEQRGTPLVDVLAIQADVARTKRFQQAERIAGRAGVLIKLPLMLIVFACLLIMFGGVAIKLSRGTLF